MPAQAEIDFHEVGERGEDIAPLDEVLGGSIARRLVRRREKLDDGDYVSRLPVANRKEFLPLLPGNRKRVNHGSQRHGHGGGTSATSWIPTALPQGPNPVPASG